MRTIGKLTNIKEETFQIHDERWTLEEVPKRHRLTIRRKEKQESALELTKL